LSENSAQERTESATPKRREDSRKKGQVPRSKELDTLSSLLGAGIGMLLLGEKIVEDVNSLLTESLKFGREEAFSQSIIGVEMLSAITEFVFLLAPLFVLLIAVVFISPISLSGWVFSTSNLAPKLERISPLKGITRIFSTKSLMELLKAIGKFMLVASITILVIGQSLDQIFMMPLLPLNEAIRNSGSLFIWCFLGFSSVLVLVALVDVPFQIWNFEREIRMTKQEIKDESKETDGKPEVKSAIRERQQEFARQRMMADVPTADVVITNPTHYAVALRYDQMGSGAPKVVAKGRDFVAARIRETAMKNNVTLFAAPPLARALYASTDIGQEIPGNLFLAVAQVLAYVFQLRKGGGSKKARPTPPKKLPIPDEYSSIIESGGND